ncbi:c-type cytochrome [Microbaculum marinum]|uniref:C-type cytochrome n=1 Tax=Microbaculum marinum TaxID=1764581 RepID=A0AAW9RTQ3_9HYPH
MTQRIVAALLVLVVGAGAIYLFMPDRKGAGIVIDPTDRAMVALGGEIYASQCAACHGAGGEGQPGWQTQNTEQNPLAPPHDGTGHTWQHPDDALFELTKSGLSTIACRTLDSDAMPKFGEILSDDQIYAVLSYIKSKWPPDILRQNVEINEIYGFQHE